MMMTFFFNPHSVDLFLLAIVVKLSIFRVLPKEFIVFHSNSSVHCLGVPLVFMYIYVCV